MAYAFEEKYTLRVTDCDMHGHIKTSRLLELLQELAGDHVDELGFGRAYTFPRGIAWIVVRQRIEFTRVPRLGETLTLRTWPGRTMHTICPRYTVIEDSEGREVLKACFIWVLMDLTTRSMVMPSKYGVLIDPPPLEAPMKMPRSPELLPENRRFSFTVPYSYMDINGHMNNTRYLDMAEDAIAAPKDGKELRELTVEFSMELRLGESMVVLVGEEENRFSFRGISGEKDIIKISLRYQ
ncbi:MAG: hypothetical protein II882_04085 [Lachnospiraceae bacterium]|nr:hypothetical protein [Lachnospiraceae bacterium]